MVEYYNTVVGITLVQSFIFTTTLRPLRGGGEGPLSKWVAVLKGCWEPLLQGFHVAVVACRRRASHYIARGEREGFFSSSSSSPFPPPPPPPPPPFPPLPPSSSLAARVKGPLSGDR